MTADTYRRKLLPGRRRKTKRKKWKQRLYIRLATEGQDTKQRLRETIEFRKAKADLESRTRTRTIEMQAGCLGTAGNSSCNDEQVAKGPPANPRCTTAA